MCQHDIINKTKKRFRENLVKDIKIFLKENTTKSNNMVANDIRISNKMTNKGSISIEKDIKKCKK